MNADRGERFGGRFRDAALGAVFDGLGAEVVAELGARGRDDFVFEAGGERRGQAVVDHGAAAFVAAFFQDSLGGDVGGVVVRVGVEPEARWRRNLF